MIPYRIIFTMALVIFFNASCLKGSNSGGAGGGKGGGISSIANAPVSGGQVVDDGENTPRTDVNTGLTENPDNATQTIAPTATPGNNEETAPSATIAPTTTPEDSNTPVATPSNPQTPIPTATAFDNGSGNAVGDSGSDGNFNQDLGNNSELTWGGRDSAQTMVISEIQDDVVIDSIADTPAPNAITPTMNLTPEGQLSFSADLAIDDANLDSRFSMSIVGKDADNKAWEYSLRFRKGKAELYFKGPHGSYTKWLTVSLQSGEFYRTEFIFYKNAVALFFSHSEYDRWNPNHIVYLPLIKDNAQLAHLQFKFSIQTGIGKIRQMRWARYLPDISAIDSPEVENDFQTWAGNAHLQTMLTRIRNLSGTWWDYTGTKVNPNFYHTTFSTGDDTSIVQGTFHEWSVLGGRTIHPRNAKKMIRWKFETKWVENLYATFITSGKNKTSGKTYQHSLVVHDNRASFYAKILSSAGSQNITPFLKENTKYTVDFLMLPDGNALYLYETEVGPPTKPQHIFQTESWDFVPALHILAGNLQNVKEYLVEATALGNYPDSVAAMNNEYQSDSEVYKTLWQSGQTQSYQDPSTLNQSYVQINGDTVGMQSDGTRYMDFASPQSYTRYPNHPEWGLHKGLKFEIKIKESGLDPIFHLGIEGVDKYGQYHRHVLIFRKDVVYAQFKNSTSWDTVRLSSSEKEASLPIKNYVMDARYFMKVEAYPNGSAIYLWKDGQNEPTEPVHVLLESEFPTFRWHTWIYRNEVMVKVHPAYDLTKTSVLETIQKGNNVQTMVTQKVDAFSESFWHSSMDGSLPYNANQNAFILEGNGQNRAVTFRYPEDLYRDRGFVINLKVNVDTAGTISSGLLVGIQGNAVNDPTGNRYRRHALEFTKNEILAQTYGSGVHGQHTVPALSDLNANVWYNLEVVGFQKGSFLTIWKEGESKPKPQSFFFSSDWPPELRIWIQNGKVQIKDLVVQRTVSPELLRSISDQSYLDEMKGGLELGPTEGLVDWQDPKVSVMANFNLLNLPFSCWQSVNSKLLDQSKTFPVYQGNNDSSWDGFSCTRSLSRSAGNKVITDFQMTQGLSAGGQVIFGFQGYRNNSPRRHALLLTAGKAVKGVISSMNGEIQVYTPKTGWKTYAKVTGLPVDKDYRLTMEVSPNGSVLRLKKLFENQEEVISHELSAEKFPGTHGELDSQALDFDPYLFLRLNKDKMAIKEIRVE